MATTGHPKRVFGPAAPTIRCLARHCAIENSGRRLCALLFVNGDVAPENYMLLIIGAVITSIAIAIIPRMRLSDGVSGSALGWMSEQWLADHRASHSA